MTIYILDNDPKKIAEYLDDKSLDKMIKDIAQVLCNVHCSFIAENNKEYKPDIMQLIDVFKLKDYFIKNPLKLYDKWTQWARECVANYKYLVNLGYALCDEWQLRCTYKYGESKHHKLRQVLAWALLFEPILPAGEMLCTADMPSSNSIDIMTPFPLVMPKSYIKEAEVANPEKWGHIDNCMYAYRVYYQANLKKTLLKELQKEKKKWTGEKWVGSSIEWTRRFQPEWIML